MNISNLRPILAGACVVLCAAGAIAAPRVLETNKYAWRPGLAPYSLVVEDGGKGTTLQIVDARNAAHSYSAGSGLATMKDALVEPAVVRDNLLKSQYLYLSPRLKGANGEPMLFFFGQGDGSGPDPIRLLELDKAGSPQVAFSNDGFLLTDIAATGAGGKSAVIGMQSLSQEDEDCVYTYDPYAVFQRTGAQANAFSYSEPLSQQYNIAHYAGWAGPKSREDIAVVGCSRDHSRIMNLAQAEKMPKPSCTSC